MYMGETELIVFVDDTGKPTGETGPKLASHNADTKLHLAFSCYIFRRKDNRFLVTQRAMGKKVWPGVWTNSVCGHPRPNESIEDAIRRRAADEIGLTSLQDIQVVLPAYRYKTPEYNGVIENEFCPVYIAFTDGQVNANPDEVEMYRWLPWKEYAIMLNDPAHADKMSYWAKDQYQQLKDVAPFKDL
jgi:isopentenyl-diphosphate delta-isomerase